MAVSKKTSSSKSSSKGLGKGLGRGINALIPEEPAETNEKVIVKEVVVKEPAETKVRLSQVEPNREQPRKMFDEDALIELSESIKQYGVLQPLLVQKKDNYYEIIAGERRWRAAKLAGVKEVPVIIKDYSDQEVMEIALIENIQREDLNPIEEAQAYQRLIKDYRLKQDEVAEKVSKSRAAITNSLRLLKLDSRVQEMVMEGKLSNGHARTIIGIEDGDKQYMIAQKIFDEKLSVREVEKLMRDLDKPEKPVKQAPENDFIYRDLEDKFSKILGSQVAIKNKNNNKGKIEIEYYSQAELDFYGLFSVDAAYVFTGMAAVTLISLIIAIISICKTSSMKKKYKEFMGGSDGTSIEELIKGNLEDVNQIKKLSIENENNIKDIYEKLEYTFQKIGVVKYDAFHEMGGKLSFALCMLDKLNNGYLVNVMHSNNGCFAYVKEIVDGQSYIELGEEEQKALDEAVAGRTGDAILGKKVNEMLENSGKNK